MNMIQKLLSHLFKAKSVVRDLDPVNDLRFLRMRSNKTEILIAPGKFHAFYYIIMSCLPDDLFKRFLFINF